MPAPPPFAKLYDLLTGALPYHSAGIFIIRNAITPGVAMDASEIQHAISPTGSGFTGETLNDIFPRIVQAGQSILTATTFMLDFLNTTQSPIAVSGVVLTVNKLSDLRYVMLACQSPRTWLPGRRLSGRLSITVQQFPG